MKMFKKDNVKYCLLIGSLFLILYVSVLSFVEYLELKQYKIEINNWVAAVTAQVIEHYPEAEYDLVQNLKNTAEDSVIKGKEILKKYGINPYETIAVTKIENQYQNHLKINFMVILGLGIIVLILVLLIALRRDKKIDEIINYLQKIQNGVYKLDLKDNSEGSLSELKNEIYKITGMLRKQAAELKREKISLSDSLSDISHQLKTPLTSISIMVDALRTNKQMPEEKRQEFIYEITRQLEWINWLVISLLKLSKLDAGTANLKQEKVKVEELVTTVAKNLSIPMEIKNQQLQIQGEKTASFIGDFNWWVEAILNITKNCMEHTEENKVIKIEYQENTLYTEIKITDQGKGISKEDLPHIFERFYKGKNASSDSVGIGLALAKRIIESQGRRN